MMKPMNDPIDASHSIKIVSEKYFPTFGSCGGSGSIQKRAKEREHTPSLRVIDILPSGANYPRKFLQPYKHPCLDAIRSSYSIFFPGEAKQKD